MKRAETMFPMPLGFRRQIIGGEAKDLRKWVSGHTSKVRRWSFDSLLWSADDLWEIADPDALRALRRWVQQRALPFGDSCDRQGGYD